MTRGDMLVVKVYVSVLKIYSDVWQM